MACVSVLWLVKRLPLPFLPPHEGGAFGSSGRSGKLAPGLAILVTLCGVLLWLPAAATLGKIPHPLPKPPPDVLSDWSHAPRPLAKPSADVLAVPREPTFFKIATGTTAGTYFPIGEALAAMISHPSGSGRCINAAQCGPEGMLAVAQTSDGSIRNVTAVDDGRVASALAQADLVDAAYRGRAPFTPGKALTHLRVIASLYPEAVHLVVAKGSAIRDAADLQGKAVSVGLTGSGTQPTAMTVLKAVGLNRRTVEILELGVFDAADMLRADGLDAFFFVGGAPLALINDLSSRGEVGLVPLSGPAFDALRTRQPLFGQITIPAQIYSRPEDVQTLSVNALWIVSADISEERIYQITRALWHESNREVLLNSHEQAGYITLESALTGLPIPLHPGAERYYREAGLFDVSEPLQEGEAEGEAEEIVQNLHDVIDDATAPETLPGDAPLSPQP